MLSGQGGWIALKLGTNKENWVSSLSGIQEVSPPASKNQGCGVKGASLSVVVLVSSPGTFASSTNFHQPDQASNPSESISPSCVKRCKRE